MDIPTGNRGKTASASWGDQLDAIAPLSEDFSSNLVACVATDLHLHLLKAVVQVSGRAMVLMISQEKAQLLNLNTVCDSEKLMILDAPVEPKGLFGLTVKMMQKQCEDKKREGEARSFCPGRHSPVTPMCLAIPLPRLHQVNPLRPLRSPDAEAPRLRAQGSRIPRTLRAPGLRSLPSHPWHQGASRPITPPRG